MIAATEQPRDRLCLACFDGDYPIELPEEEVLGKHLLERALPLGRRATCDVEGVTDGLSGGGRGALQHPERRRQEPTLRPRDEDRMTGGLRGGRRLDRGRRPGRRADEGVGREGQAPRDARRHRRLRRPLRRQRAQGLRAAAARDHRRRRRHQGRDRAGDGRAPHHRLRPGRHARRRPRGLRRRAALPHRLHRHRPRRTGADRGDRPGHRRGLRRRRLRAASAARPPSTRACSGPTSTTSPARPPAWSRRPTCSVPAGSGPATRWSRWPRAGCTATATPWSGTSCSTRRGLVAGPPRRRARPDAGRGAAGADPDLRQGLPRPGPQTRTHAMSHITGGGLAANLERVLPDEVAVTVDRSTWTPAADLRPGRLGRVGRAHGPRADPQLRRRHGRPGRPRRRQEACDATRRARRRMRGSAGVAHEVGHQRPGSVTLVGDPLRPEPEPQRGSPPARPASGVQEPPPGR